MAIYFDCNATTPMAPEVFEAMHTFFLEEYGNPGSRTHEYGNRAKKGVEAARREIATALGLKVGDRVIFTSGATESNNQAFFGLENYARKSQKNRIIVSSIEHKAVLEPAAELEKRGFEVIRLQVCKNGQIDLEHLKNALNEKTFLVSIMHVNNETGTIQPVHEIGEALKGTEVYFHVDASQSCGKLVEELRDLSYDLLSVSAHKMYGPQGVGALVIKNKNGNLSALKPIMFGGGQERGMRPGTLPAALIGGMGEAADILVREYKDNHRKCGENRRMIWKALEESGVTYEVNGDPSFGINSTLNISFRDYDSEALMLAMEMEGLGGISNGSACTSHNYAPSYVLEAMGLDKQRIACSVRISWGREPIDRQVILGMLDLVKEWQK